MFEITNRFTNLIIFQGEAQSLLALLEEAVLLAWIFPSQTLLGLTCPRESLRALSSPSRT